MSWRNGDLPHPVSYLSLLYEDEEEALNVDSEDEFGNDEGIQRPNLPTSYSTNVDTHRQPIVIKEESHRESDEEKASKRRYRSRSPLRPQRHDAIPGPSRVDYARGSMVVAVFNQDGNRLDQDEEESFEDSDEHYIFPPPEVEMDVSEDENVDVFNAEGRGRRSRGRARGRVRGRGRGRGRGHRAQRDPLTEVYMDDEGVPDELKCMVKDVILNRQIKARENERQVRMYKERVFREIEEEDVYEDALADPELQQFSWQPAGSYVPVPEEFIPQGTGPTAESRSPYDAFRRYWSDDILQQIVNEINCYATTVLAPTFRGDWYETNHHEILCLFAFWMMLGIIRMPTITSCFSRDPLLQTAIFKTIFTYQRFCHLSRALSFLDSASSSDKLCALRPIITHLNCAFKCNYVPNQQICIDEAVTLGSNQLIKTKVATFGIKTYELYESASGYLWSFLVDTGKDTENDASLHIHKSTQIVLKLIRPLLNKGYQLFMNKCFNSPLLARFLKRNGTDCIGTLSPSQEDVPPLFNLAKLKQGQFVARQSGDICIMTCMQDRKTTTTLSTCHGVATGLSTVSSCLPPRPIQFKHQVVLDYNRNIREVDFTDQMLEPYLFERKRSSKWYIRLLKRLLNCSILNSRILVQSSTQAPQDNLAFRLLLVDEILKFHLQACPRPRTPGRIFEGQWQGPGGREAPVGHWPTRVPQRDADSARNRKSTQKCALCLRQGRKNTKTPFQCEVCSVPLCVAGCFKAYHNS